MGRSRPVRVKSAVLVVRRSPPVFPDKQTFSEFGGMSQRCQHRKVAALPIVVRASPLRRAKGASERTIEEGTDPMNQFGDISECEKS